MSSLMINAPKVAHGGALSIDNKSVIFLTARDATDRSGLSKYLKAENIDLNNEEQKRAATARYHQLPLLKNPDLHALALEVLKQGRTLRIDSARLFPATLWINGVEDTHDGRDFLGNFEDFAKLLMIRATALAPKRQGWVVEPTTNSDGHRANASTKAIHAIFLDNDGRGDWSALLNALEHLNFAFIAYQSGGWTPEIPKWRIVLPLVTPFDTSTEQKQDLWKQLYHHVRTVFGAVAQLSGEGFDPSTDTPCCPWFLTERRNPQDPLRKVVWRTGYALDLVRFMLELPPIEVAHETRTVHKPRSSGNGLSDEKLEEIITALSKVTSSLPSGRHELYLSLPGVLLDREVLPDEVLAIIEAVSLNYPRSHPALHADNMHGARTTIDKWESGSHITRIGTLNERWPNVAKALDEVLPNKLNTLLQTSIEAINTNTVPLTNTPTPTKKRRRKLTELGKQVLPIVASMKKSSNDRRRYAATLIDCILDGAPFSQKTQTPAEIDVLVCFITEQLGYNLPLTTTWTQILDLANVTLLSMDFTQSVERVKKAEIAFFTGQGKKRKAINKNNAEVEARRKKSRDLLNAALTITKGNC